MPEDNIQDMLNEAERNAHGVPHIEHCLDYLKQAGFKHAVVLAAVDVNVAFPGLNFGDPAALKFMASAFLSLLPEN